MCKNKRTCAFCFYLMKLETSFFQVRLVDSRHNASYSWSFLSMLGVTMICMFLSLSFFFLLQGSIAKWAIFFVIICSLNYNQFSNLEMLLANFKSHFSKWQICVRHCTCYKNADLFFMFSTLICFWFTEQTFLLFLYIIIFSPF